MWFQQESRLGEAVLPRPTYTPWQHLSSFDKVFGIREEILCYHKAQHQQWGVVTFPVGCEDGT